MRSITSINQKYSSRFHSSITFLDWIILFSLGAIWGSSFILMKIASRSYDPVEIAGLRMFFAGIILLPSFFKKIHSISPKLWLWIFMVAMLGSGIPSIFFGYASKRIDSNLIGVINSMTPIFTLIVASKVFKISISKINKLGIALGFIGVVTLFVLRGLTWGNILAAMLPLLATIMYGININLIKEKLSHLSPMDILIYVFGLLALIFLPYLILNHSFSNIQFDSFASPFWIPSPDIAIQKTRSIVALFILGLIGSSFASLLFYYLLQKTNSLFASTNTYLIPLMSIFWGFLDGEPITQFHFFSLALILFGVYLVSKK